MNDLKIELSSKVEELIGILQCDVEHLNRTLSYLNDLRSLVVKRDEKALGRLLEDIRIEGQEYAGNEQRRSEIRGQLGELLGCNTGKLTLTVLKTHLVGPAKTAIAEFQQKLKTLTGRLQGEYVATVALLSDCARINSLLLKAIFERGRAGLVCYDSTGQTPRQSDAAFMNMRL